MILEFYRYLRKRPKSKQTASELSERENLSYHAHFKSMFFPSETIFTNKSWFQSIVWSCIPFSWCTQCGRLLISRTSEFWKVFCSLKRPKMSPWPTLCTSITIENVESFSQEFCERCTQDVHVIIVTPLSITEAQKHEQKVISEPLMGAPTSPSTLRKRSQSIGGTASEANSASFVLPEPRPASAASVVHQDPSFDPTTRIFTEDELRPQPILRKRKKQYVADEQKTEKYWEKRAKNNNAARRSREAKRLRENQVIEYIEFNVHRVLSFCWKSCRCENVMGFIWKL